MSNSVTTAIRGSVRDMAIGKTKTTEKADRATVEQAIDSRTRMVLFKMLNRGVFHEMNGCISTASNEVRYRYNSVILHYRTSFIQKNAQRSEYEEKALLSHSGRPAEHGSGLKARSALIALVEERQLAHKKVGRKSYALVSQFELKPCSLSLLCYLNLDVLLSFARAEMKDEMSPALLFRDFSHSRFGLDHRNLQLQAKPESPESNSESDNERNQSLLAMDDTITFLARLERIKEKTAPSSPATSASAVGSTGGSSALGTYASIPTEAFAPERPMPPFLPLTPLLTNRE
ncbi:hypothetical protein AgCh_025072 [Apium graveolens]